MESRLAALAWSLFILAVFYAMAHFLSDSGWSEISSYFELATLGSYLAGVLLGWTAVGSRGWLNWFADRPRIIFGGLLLLLLLLIAVRRVLDFEGSLLPFLKSDKFLLGLLVGGVVLARTRGGRSK